VAVVGVLNLAISRQQDIALIYALLDENPTALERLEKAKPHDDASCRILPFENLRSDPRFGILEARLTSERPWPAF
jgi:hypothetical protein